MATRRARLIGASPEAVEVKTSNADQIKGGDCLCIEWLHLCEFYKQDVIYDRPNVYCLQRVGPKYASYDEVPS